MPDWLAWLLPVPVATLLAVLWTAWTGRSRGPADPVDSVRAHQRSMAALTAPRRTPGGAAWRRGRVGHAPRDARSDARSTGRRT